MFCNINLHDKNNIYFIKNVPFFVRMAYHEESMSVYLENSGNHTVYHFVYLVQICFFSVTFSLTEKKNSSHVELLFFVCFVNLRFIKILFYFHNFGCNDLNCELLLNLHVYALNYKLILQLMCGSILCSIGVPVIKSKKLINLRVPDIT